MTKGREIIIFVKSQPAFDIHRLYLDVSLIDLQAIVSQPSKCLKFMTFREGCLSYAI